MQSIWKYPIETTDRQHIEMPVGSRLLCVQIQGGQPCLWAQVDTDAPLKRRLIAVHGTGHEVLPLDRNDGRGPLFPEYVGTYQLARGFLVFHVYDHGLD